MSFLSSEMVRGRADGHRNGDYFFLRGNYTPSTVTEGEMQDDFRVNTLC